MPEFYPLSVEAESDSLRRDRSLPVAACGALRLLHVGPRRVSRRARLRAIKADILENLDYELTVRAIALRHGVTPRYIHMLFKMEGVTFCEFVLGQRLMHAYTMISDTRFAGLNITSIAFAAGFGDLSYFNRTFRRRFGTTPSRLRKAV
jgi:AraC-like DNA-binding protein